MKTPNEKEIYITKNLSDEQFEQFLNYIVQSDGNWSQDEIDSFKESRWTIKNVQGYWEDWYEEDGTIDASTLFNEITRFEYISKNGREIVEHGKFEFQLQDGEQTLKVFKIDECKWGTKEINR